MDTSSFEHTLKYINGNTVYTFENTEKRARKKQEQAVCKAF